MDYYSESRMKRALEQPMYLLSAEYKPTDEWYFVIQGYSGSNYDVVLTRTKMECTCPDFLQRKKLCKHLYFIIARVAKDNYSLKKLNEYTNIYEINNNFTKILESRLVKCVKLLPEENKNKNEENCVICFDTMKKSHIIINCSTCNNNFHRTCLKRWLISKETCPLCRRIIKLDEDNNSLLYFDNLI